MKLVKADDHHINELEEAIESLEAPMEVGYQEYITDAQWTRLNNLANRLLVRIFTLRKAGL